MPRPAARRALPVLAALVPLVFAGCAGTQVVGGAEGPTIAEAQAQPYDGPKARIAVGPIVDKSGGAGKRSLSYQLELLHGLDRRYERLDARAVTGGIRDLLTTALFNSNRFIVLEREAIDEVLVEQEFGASGRAGEASRIPLGQIEGAELLVVGALTAFDAGQAGGVAFPIPIPLNAGRDMAIINVRIRRSYASMDVRIIDVATSRILAAVAVEGGTTKFGAGLAGYASSRYGHIELPLILHGFFNTPVEQALRRMVDAAVDNIIEKTPPVYFEHEAPSPATETPKP